MSSLKCEEWRKNADGSKKAQQNRRPVGRPAEYMKEQSYAAVLYGRPDFSKA